MRSRRKLLGALAENHYARLKKIEASQKGKDRDIGYAPAAHSCERVGNVDACTVAVLDAITAFAVPNPGVSSQIRRIFRVWPLRELPRSTDHSAYFGMATVY